MSNKLISLVTYFLKRFLLFMSPMVLVSCVNMAIPQEAPEHPAVTKAEIDAPDLTFSLLAWHPSQQRIAADGLETCLGDICPTGIYEINTSNGRVTKLADSHGSPNWLADGESLSFAWSTPDESGIFISSANDFSPVFFHDGSSAVWSPNGNYVAVAKRDYDGSTGRKITQLVVINLQTGEEIEFFQTPWATEARIDGIAWSPDSSELAFAVTWYQEGKEKTEDHIFIAQPDGTQWLLLSQDRVRYPGWLPDGKWLFFTFGKEKRLAFVHIEKGCVIETDITNVDYPTISPDGKTIAFSFGDIYLIDLNKLLGAGQQLLVCQD